MIRFVAPLAMASAMSASGAAAAQDANPTHRYFGCMGQNSDQSNPEKFYIGLRIAFDGESLNGFEIEAPERYFSRGPVRLNSEAIGKNLTELRVSRVNGSGIAHLIEIGFADRAEGVIIFRGALTNFQIVPGTEQVTLQTNEIAADRKISQHSLVCAQVYSDENYQVVRSSMIDAGAKP